MQSEFAIRFLLLFILVIICHTERFSSILEIFFKKFFFKLHESGYSTSY